MSQAIHPPISVGGLPLVGKQMQYNTFMANQYTKNPIDPVEAFWAKVDKTGDCWLWTGGKYPNGYGHFRGGGAHRYSYEITFGGTAGQDVLHHCDNPACVRPDHLFLGSQQDNYWDMANKGRGNPPRGERQHQAKLRSGDIPEIRRLGASGMSQQKIALLYGVSQTTIGDVLLRVSWKHIP